MHKCRNNTIRLQNYTVALSNNLDAAISILESLEIWRKVLFSSKEFREL